MDDNANDHAQVKGALGGIISMPRPTKKVPEGSDAVQIGPISAPLHLALGDLGADVEGNPHAEIGVARLHGGNQGRRILGLGLLLLEGGEIRPGMIDAGKVSPRLRRHVTRNDDDGLARGDLVEVGDPGRALRRDCRCRGTGQPPPSVGSVAASLRPDRCFRTRRGLQAVPAFGQTAWVPNANALPA